MKFKFKSQSLFNSLFLVIFLALLAVAASIVIQLKKPFVCVPVHNTAAMLCTKQKVQVQPTTYKKEAKKSVVQTA